MATEFDAHECEYCEGSGTGSCHCCDADTDCEHCHGTGKDSDLFDTARFAQDKKAFVARMYQIARQSPNGFMIAAGFMIDGKSAGIEGGNGERLLLESYRFEEPANAE